MSKMKKMVHFWLPVERRESRDGLVWPGGSPFANLCGMPDADDNELYSERPSQVTCRDCKALLHAPKAPPPGRYVATMTSDGKINILDKAAPTFDPVSKPAHYNAGGVECIDALAAATIELKGIEAVCTANAIKYLWRWKLKNGAEDLKKARWYLDRLIKHVEGAKS